MKIITKDIKTIKDLRKYVNSIDWYNKEFNEKDQKQFSNEIIVSLSFIKKGRNHSSLNLLFKMYKSKWNDTKKIC